ncbi:hypothetical protein AWENTII_002938 [Aspergillus wentii]
MMREEMISSWNDAKATLASCISRNLTAFPTRGRCSPPPRRSSHLVPKLSGLSLIPEPQRDNGGHCVSFSLLPTSISFPPLQICLLTDVYHFPFLLGRIVLA